MSSSHQLKSLIQKQGWNETINDLVWLYQLENKKPIESIPFISMGHLFTREINNHIEQVKNYIPVVDWSSDIINHNIQYPIDEIGQLKNYHLNNVDFIISGNSLTTGNYVSLKIEKWESRDGSTGLRYNIHYYFGKEINGALQEETFSSLKQVGDFVTLQESSTLNN